MLPNYKTNKYRLLEYDRREVSFEEEINTRSNVNNIDMEMVEIYKKAIGAELNIVKDKTFALLLYKVIKETQGFMKNMLEILKYQEH